MTEFGKFLRKIRIDREELLYTMANALGVSPAFLSAVETGRKPIPHDLPSKIVTLYHLSDEQAQELYEVASASMSHVRINLDDDFTPKKEMVMAFTRKIDSLTDDEIEAINSVLSGGKR